MTRNHVKHWRSKCSFYQHSTTNMIALMFLRMSSKFKHLQLVCIDQASINEVFTEIIDRHVTVCWSFTWTPFPALLNNTRSTWRIMQMLSRTLWALLARIQTRKYQLPSNVSKLRQLLPMLMQLPIVTMISILHQSSC